MYDYEYVRLGLNEIRTVTAREHVCEIQHSYFVDPGDDTPVSKPSQHVVMGLADDGFGAFDLTTIPARILDSIPEG